MSPKVFPFVAGVLTVVSIAEFIRHDPVSGIIDFLLAILCIILPC